MFAAVSWQRCPTKQQAVLASGVALHLWHTVLCVRLTLFLPAANVSFEHCWRYDICLMRAWQLTPCHPGDGAFSMPPSMFGIGNLFTLALLCMRNHSHTIRKACSYTPTLTHSHRLITACSTATYTCVSQSQRRCQQRIAASVLLEASASSEHLAISCCPASVSGSAPAPGCRAFRRSRQGCRRHPCRRHRPPHTSCAAPRSPHSPLQ